jgi:hypothetical protein
MVNISFPTNSTNLILAAKARSWRAWAPALAFCLYALAIILVGARHEPWFDEAQAWLIARDATPLEIITRYGRYEGTPPLWHLILWAPAHLGYPYRFLWLISGSFALAGAGLVLFRAPFPFLMRCGIVAGYFFAYQYPIVARSYVLDLALFPLLAMLFEKRLEQPLAYCAVLALLANANTHSFLISGILGLDYGVAAFRSSRWKESRVLAGAALYGVFALAAVAMAWPPNDVSFGTYGISPLMAFRAAVLMAEPFVERVDIWAQAGPSGVSQLWGMVCTVVLLSPSLLLFSQARTQMLFLGAFAVFFALTAAKYGQPWHSGVLYMVWVFALWVSWPSLPKLAPLERMALFASLFVILAVQAWYTAAAWSREVSQTYSPGENVAKAIANYRQIHPDAHVEAFGCKTFAVQPWAPRNLFHNFNGGAKTPAFYDWRASQPFTSTPTLSAWTETVGKAKRDILLLSDFEHITDAERDRYYALAAKAGFCLRFFDGQMIWKTHSHEPLGIAMFTRCNAQ